MLRAAVRSFVAGVILRPRTTERFEPKDLVPMFLQLVLVQTLGKRQLARKIADL